MDFKTHKELVEYLDGQACRARAGSEHATAEQLDHFIFALSTLEPRSFTVTVEFEGDFESAREEIIDTLAHLTLSSKQIKNFNIEED